MGILNGVADLLKKVHTFLNRHQPVITVLCNRFSVYVFHYQIWQTLIGYPSIIKACNIGMVQTCQNLLLALETDFISRSSHLTPDQFQRNSLFKVSVISFSQKNRPHSAMAY